LDITSPVLLAFFNPAGMNIGVGWSITKYDRIPIGWPDESQSLGNTGIGFSEGIENGFSVSCGWIAEGAQTGNLPIAFAVRRQMERNYTIGVNIAIPTDRMVRAGFSIGNISAFNIQAGWMVQGHAECVLHFRPIDPNVSRPLCAEIAVSKQKDVKFVGSNPEELD
jgi:hypothetical protein